MLVGVIEHAAIKADCSRVEQALLVGTSSCPRP